MSRRGLRWVWFLGLVLLAPWPLSAIGDAYVPAIRYLMLGAAGLAVALTEGAQGPVPMIIGLFVVAGLGYTALCLALAGLIVRALERLGTRPALGVTLLALVAALAVGLIGTPYLTPFGHAPRGGLIEILS